MNLIFRVVYLALQWLSGATGLTYNEINIVFYFFVVPLALFLLVDCIIKKIILAPALIVVWVTLLLVPNFSLSCDRLFDASVVFLHSFGFLGWNYIVASVMICVVFSAVAFTVPCYFAFPKLLRRRFKQRAKSAT